MPARLFELTKEFIKLGHSATFITSDSNHLASYPYTKEVYNFENIDTVPVCWIKTKKYAKTVSISRVLSWFDFEKKLFYFPKSKLSIPDVVIVSSLSIFTIIYGYYLKRKYRSFLVFEIRDIWPLSLIEVGNFSKWHPLVLLIGFIEKFGYKKSDLIVGTMPKLDLHVADILGYEKPFFCSPQGFNPDNYKINIIKNKNPFDDIFPKSKLIVGYAGNMGISNALEPFISAIKMFNNNINIHFVLVGSGDLKDKFKADLENYNNVTFLSRIAQNQVKYFLYKCDILYFSTENSRRWKYGQSMNKIVEYMLASKPIIASYTGYQSMINEAHCGEFIRTSNYNDLKQAISNIASLSLQERQKMGKNGNKWLYENRQYSKLAKEYIEKILELKDNN
ncbi:MAG: glycosyltransferase family 4 protein [Sulfurospirillum sp.]|nr:glycosyltransferase family 4 protein [Sulfurospirillum sp.]